MQTEFGILLHDRDFARVTVDIVRETVIIDVSFFSKFLTAIKQINKKLFFQQILVAVRAYQ
jgi:hypothetical protein